MQGSDKGYKRVVGQRSAKGNRAFRGQVFDKSLAKRADLLIFFIQLITTGRLAVDRNTTMGRRQCVIVITVSGIIGIISSGTVILCDRFIFRANKSTFNFQFSIHIKGDEGPAICDFCRAVQVRPVVASIKFKTKLFQASFGCLRIFFCLRVFRIKLIKFGFYLIKTGKLLFRHFRQAPIKPPQAGRVAIWKSIPASTHFQPSAVFNASASIFSFSNTSCSSNAGS